MKKLDFNKIRAGLMLPTAIGAAAVAIGFVLTFILTVLSSYFDIVNDAINILAGTLGLVISLLQYMFFMALFVWAGYRVAHKYQADAMEAGVTSAISYISIALINLVLTLILTIFSAVGLISYTAITTGIGGEHSDIALAVLGSDTSGAIGIILNLCCSVGLILVGGLFNFVIGAIGGLIGEKK